MAQLTTYSHLEASSTNMYLPQKKTYTPVSLTSEEPSLVYGEKPCYLKHYG